MGTLTITTLGDPLIQHDAVPCIFLTRKALALALYLAVTSQPHTRTHLIALLWPEADAAHGSTNLRQTLGRIRQALGTDADTHLLTPGDLVRLEMGPGSTLDLTQVDAAIPATTASAARLAALNRYQGSFCASLTIDDAPDFMAWVLAQRAHWDACYDVMAEHEMQICLASGQAEDAVTLGKAWVRLRPDIEVAYRLLATAQATAGDVTGARLTLADCAQVWANLALALDPATMQLQEQMQALPANTPSFPAAHTIRLPFVGRQEAFSRFRGAYERVRAGRPHLALIEGEAGVGKSRLLGAFTQWAALQGADVVLGQAYELSGRFPFQPLAELVRARLAREHAPDDLLDDPWLTELSRLVPELRERYPDLPPPMDDAGAGARLVEALAQAGLALARSRPVVWVIEDLHWADEATRAALTALLGRWQTEGAAILLVVTLRAEERATSPDLQGWVAAAERLAPVVPITLAALTTADSQQATMKLLSNTASTALCDWLFAVTAGNPLYLEQVTQGLVERGVVTWQDDTLRSTSDLDVSQLADWVPDTLRELLLRRIRYLDTTTQRVVAAAAVAGGRFTEEVVQAIAGVDEEAALTALEVAERRQLIRIEGSQYGFTHDKVAEAVYGDLHAGRRRLMHRRALAFLEHRHLATSADLFRHAVAAEAWPDAVRHGQQATTEASHVGAHLDIIRIGGHLIRLLTTPPSCDVLREHVSDEQRSLIFNWVANAHLEIGNTEQARATYQALLTEAQISGSRYLQAEALGLLAHHILNFDSEPRLAQRLFEEAYVLYEAIGDRQELLATKSDLARVALNLEDLPRAWDEAHTALRLAREDDETFEIGKCLNVLSSVHLRRGEWEAECVVDEESLVMFAAQARSTDSTIPPPPPFVRPRDWSTFLPIIAPFLQSQTTLLNNSACQWGAWMLVRLGAARLHLGEGATGRAALALAWQIITQRHEPRFFHLYLLHRTWGWLEDGAYQDAWHEVEQVRAAMRAGTVISTDPTRVTSQCSYVDIFHAILQLAQAHEELEAATRYAENKAAWERLLPATRWCTQFALAGEWSKAYEAAMQAHTERAATPTQLNGYDLARYYETEALLRAGERERAMADAQRLHAALGTNRRYRLMWLRMQALLEDSAGDHYAAIAHLHEALHFAEAMALPGEQWPVAAALAAQLGRQGDAVAAHQARAQAEAVIDGLAASITDTALRDHFAREARQRLPQG